MAAQAVDDNSFVHFQENGDSVVVTLDSATAAKVIQAQEETRLKLEAESKAIEKKMKKIEDDSVKIKKALEQKAPKQKRDWQSWRPDIKKAMWLAIVIPGGGQIYNRKYWKLPIVYGGMVGCIYAWRWNGQMYSDYAKAYQDMMDDDPTTKSYESFLHLGTQITDANIDRYKTLFKSRKDRYLRWRDLSMFCLIGVYGLSIIDAYVDASLSSFDITEDLSMKVTPAYINSSGVNMVAARSNAIQTGGLGIRCRLNF